MKFLLVESDDDLRQFLTEMFHAGQHQVTAYKKLKGIKATDLEQADLLVLDWDHNPEEVGSFVLERSTKSRRSSVILLCIDPPVDQRILHACMEVYVKPNISRLNRFADSP
ncbi:MAG: hypothetical protein ACK5RO_11400 [Pseudobdellovibrionaceae bacterium]